MSSDAPFFIVGAGRSGTTLLRLMLTGHSRLHIPDETWFIQKLVRRLPCSGALSRAQVATALALMTGHERWPDMAFPADALRAQALSLPSPRLAEVIGLVFRHCSAASRKPRIGDKTPHYFAILPQLAQVFPDAKFIHLIRDGRDVAISWIDAGWNRYHERNFEWTAAMRQRHRWRDGPLRERVCEVRYEALVGDPELELRRVCTFLGEQFEPAMLQVAPRQKLVAERDRHLHRRLAEPLSAGSIGVWQQRLAGWECFAIEACLHRHLRSAGYQPRYAARHWRPLLTLTAAALVVASPLLRFAVPRLQRRGWLPKRLYI